MRGPGRGPFHTSVYIIAPYHAEIILFYQYSFFITFAVIVTVTGTSMQRSWFMLLFQLQFGQICNFLTVDGSINFRFDVSVTVTALGPLQLDFFYCKKTS